MAQRKTLNDLQYAAYLNGFNSVTGPNKVETETVTFAALTTGSVDTHPLFTVTGVVSMTVWAKVGTDATSGGSATIEVGTALSTAALLPQVAFSVLDANEIWHDATPDTSVELESVLTKKIVTQSVAYKIATATITGGTIKFFCSWYPISSDGYVSVVSPIA
jgi:hypothetical protein